MQTQDIRRKFLKYFKDKQHAIVASSPVVPFDDPTLLFTNAGMNQFKDVFLGKSARDYKRAATSQKCIRVGGKHNDLENVGHTKRHLTFFEMLGNFSFGDYFKSDAIKFAWEVSTEVFGIDPDRIWPTVFRDDDEAFELWTKYVPVERITRFGEKHNFWEMGETGPCGPCSELLFDRGPAYGDAPNPASDTGEERYLEFWNLVFMQFNRDETGNKNPLPKPSIDTGAGLERVVALNMNVDSLFETDVLRSLIDQVEEVSGVKYDLKDSAKYPAFRVIADHLRSLSFAIADGAQPSNVERGYVLRKILRRAVRYGRLLGMDEPFLAKVLPRLITTMGSDYPELVHSQSRIAEILTAEEEAFIRTLKRGGNLLNQIIDHARVHGHRITGDEAFKLKDTYGFPLEEILLLAKDASLVVDETRYNALEEEARERSRKAQKTTKQIAAESLFVDHIKKHGISHFVGYESTSAHSKVTALVVEGKFVNEMQVGDEGMVILESTPFYAEKGGQIGDTGDIYNELLQFQVRDTQMPYKGVIAHVGKMEKGSLRIGQEVQSSISEPRRQKIANNHTATHLLHWALQKVLGPHVKQAGSVVDDQRLRFDFSHHKALTPEQIREIEDIVNGKIRENKAVHSYELTLEEVQKKAEIKQFFGEKYDSIVRVIDIDYSKELCGGTHTLSTGNIGYFRVAKESSIAAGVRRVEAVTGEEAETFARSSEELLNQVSDALKAQPHEILARLEKLGEENKKLAQELKAHKGNQLQNLLANILKKVETHHDIPLLVTEASVTPDELRDLVENAIMKMNSGVVVMGATEGDKCLIISRVSPDLIAKGVKANEIIQAIAPIIDGKGGGKPDSARAGGKAPGKLKEALDSVKKLLER